MDLLRVVHSCAEETSTSVVKRSRSQRNQTHSTSSQYIPLSEHLRDVENYVGIILILFDWKSNGFESESAD